MRVFTMLPMRHWRDAGPFAAAAEAAGFDALMTVELGHDVFTPLAFAALATERIELTPSIAVAFPRSPTVTASQAWDLPANSNGRFVLGLGRRANFDVFGGGFVVTGSDAQIVAEGMEWARRRIAIYSSTRTYAPILGLHGLEEVGAKLHAMSVAGRWNDMPAEITDDVVRIFAACGTYDEIAAAIEARYGGLAHAVQLDFPAGTPAGLQRELLSDIPRLPPHFPSL